MNKALEKSARKALLSQLEQYQRVQGADEVFPLDDETWKGATEEERWEVLFSIVKGEPPKLKDE